jgi:TIR domain/VHL beta domain
MHIFLSYAAPDKGAAESIAFSLRNRGYKVFLDRDDLPAGQSYDEQIWGAVKKSQFFIFLISPDSVAEGRYALTELKFARRKWNEPSGRVLPVLVRKTPLDTVPSYLKAVTILEPAGNIAAETSAAIDDMRQASRLVSAAWRVAAKLPARYRYAIAIGTSCAVAALLAFVFSGRSDPSRSIPTAPPAPAPAPIKCKEEGTLRSLEANVQTSIVFTNRGNQPIRVYWLDYDGKRILYETLGTGEVGSNPTYVTHPWLITDAKDNCKAIYMPTPERLEVSVSD